jgi:uncharacterized protein
MKPNYRRCISCRKIATKESFWRVVRVYPGDRIALDRGSGRSAYICPNTDCIEQASPKRLSRALKTSVPEDICQNLQKRLADKC